MSLPQHELDQRIEEQIDIPRDAVLPLIAGLIDQYQRLEADPL